MSSTLLLLDLREHWLHLVSQTGACEVYVGRAGDGRWGNRVTCPARRACGSYERAVIGYGEWLLSDAAQMAEVRTRLAGRMLGCHCRQRGLPCHAEVLAAVANCTHDEYRALLSG